MLKCKLKMAQRAGGNILGHSEANTRRVGSLAYYKPKKEYGNMRTGITTLLLFFFLVSNAISNQVSFYEKLNLMDIPIIFITVFILFFITVCLVFALFSILFKEEK